jgi:hypothetical protein
LNDAAMALSKLSLFEPTEATMSSSASRWL